MALEGEHEICQWAIAGRYLFEKEISEGDRSSHWYANKRICFKFASCGTTAIGLKWSGIFQLVPSSRSNKKVEHLQHWKVFGEKTRIRLFPFWQFYQAAQSCKFTEDNSFWFFPPYLSNLVDCFFEGCCRDKVYRIIQAGKISYSRDFGQKIFLPENVKVV